MAWVDGGRGERNPAKDQVTCLRNLVVLKCSSVKYRTKKVKEAGQVLKIYGKVKWQYLGFGYTYRPGAQGQSGN